MIGDLVTGEGERRRAREWRPRTLPLGVVLLLVVAAQPATFTQRALPAASTILVELFTSEGCSSCPPADALLQRIADAPPTGANVVVLGEHVDYWDQQGWRDRFSSPAFTSRQQVYASRFNIDSIYTPQLVVDGRAQLVGSDASAATRAIERARTAPHGAIYIAVEQPVTARPELVEGRAQTLMVRQAHHERVAASNAAESVTNDAASRVTVSVTAADLPPLDRGDRADIVVAVTEDGLSSDVKRGENRGRTLAHAAVVRQLATIGEATGGGGSAHAELTLAPDWKRERLKLVGFVQERRARAVLAVAAVPLAVVKSQVGSLKSEPKPRSMKNDSAIGFELRRGRLTSDFRLQTSDFSER